MTERGDEDVEAGLARRLTVADSLIPARPAWRLTLRDDTASTSVRVLPGSAFRGRPGGSRSIGALLATGLVILLVAAYWGLGFGTGPAPSARPPNPTASPSTPSATPTAGLLHPVIEPGLEIPTRPATAWTVVEDSPNLLNLAYFLEDVGSNGYSVGLMVVEPQGIYDPATEEGPLPLPADLIDWIRHHPDLDAGEPSETTVAGLPATAIDVTVTYPAKGPKGQTAAFIDIGPGSWNLESPSRKRIVLVQLPDRPLLIVFDSRPEFFDAGIGAFESLLGRIRFEELGPSP